MPGFQPNNLAISGSITSVTITEPGAAPSNIIEKNQIWGINVTVNLNGSGVPLLGGHIFEITANLESIGQGYEGTVGRVDYLVPQGLGYVHNFFVHIKCPPAQTLPGYVDGLYEAAIILALKSDAVLRIPLGLVGYQENLYVEFFSKIPP
ncbi:Uncharacterised protein [uncultured archaeon]|nr:Uncharacterised protein [uncultured archaeon]